MKKPNCWLRPLSYLPFKFDMIISTTLWLAVSWWFYTQGQSTTTTLEFYLSFVVLDYLAGVLLAKQGEL